MLAVLQILQDGQMKIMRNVSNGNDFVKYVKDLIRDFVEVRSTFENFKNNTTFPCDKYLVFDERIIYYVNRTKKIEVGYIYNSESMTDVILGHWELVEYDQHINSHCPIIETNTETETKHAEKICNTIDVPLFNTSTIKMGSNILVIASRLVDKTYLIGHLLEVLNSEPDRKVRETGENILIVNNLENGREYYKTLFPSANIHLCDNSDDFDLVDDSNTNVVVYDSRALQPERKIQLLEKFSTSARNKTLIYSEQCLVGLKPQARAQFDYVFCFGDNIVSNTKKLWMSFGQSVQYYEHFKNIFEESTREPNSMLVINVGVNNYQPIFHKYKAPGQ